MDRQQSEKKGDGREVHKPPLAKKFLAEPSPDSPMGKFNKAMRKILSVPKNNLKDK